MENHIQQHFGKFNLATILAHLQGDEYKLRVEQAKRDVESMKRHAIIDRARLFIPVDF